ncbi:16S rRNA (cytosine(1402)-N(4))-methyltransferase RsmH, partial [Hydrogenivirga sp.]
MHTPVLIEESTDLLLGNEGKLYVDCTLGLGGHTRRILEKNPEAFVVGIDRDEEAIELAEENLKEFEGRFTIYKANFADLDAVLEAEGIEKVDGFLFDLGVSMLQLKSERGFSFQIEAPLDMRMDKEQRLTAYKVVNEYPEKELARIIWEYGEERLSRKIARAIVQYRKKKPIETTKELTDIILSVYPERL